MKKEAFALAQPKVKQIEYVNKRGQQVRVFPWTLNNRTTLYTGGETVAAKYTRGSKKA